MCGRFTLIISPQDLAEYFKLFEIPSLEERYNIAPSEEVAAIRMEEGKRRLAWLRWGLVPFWADDPKTGYRMINARAETVHSKPSFRAAFRQRRCLIPASGFFEWKTEGSKKQPYYIRMKDEKPMAFAGLWEHWEDRKGKEEPVDSCTIIVGDANQKLATIHDRMPIILRPEDYGLWLEPECHDIQELRNLLKPIESEALSLYPVSPYVNKPQNKEEKCIEPAAEE